jgi:hypothetical protein
MIPKEACDPVGRLHANSAERVSAFRDPRAQLSPRDYGAARFVGFYDRRAVLIDGDVSREKEVFGEV